MNSIISIGDYAISKDVIKESEINIIAQELTCKLNDGYNNSTRDICLMREYADRICIPRGYAISKYGIEQVRELYKPKHVDRIEDYSNIVFTGTLREYQQETIDIVLDKIKSSGGGLIIAPCGSGKTVMMINLIAQLKMKTLVIAHKKFLLKQFIERMESYTNMKTRKKLGSSDRRSSDRRSSDRRSSDRRSSDRRSSDRRSNDIFIEDMISSVTIQSLSSKKNITKIINMYDLILIDEIHHGGAESYRKLFPRIRAKYIIGVTATSYREDNMFDSITHFLGPILHVIPNKIQNNVDVLLINYKSTDTENMRTIYHDNNREKINKSTMITNLCKINDRNNMCAKLISELNQDDSKYILALTGRLEQIDEIIRIMKDMDSEIDYGKYIGGMKQEQLNESAKKKIIFATFDMAQEGLDIPSLNTLILLSPKSNVQQSVGRILRKGFDKSYNLNDNIRPLIVDIIDKSNISYYYQYQKRLKLYEHNKYNFYSLNIVDVMKNSIHDKEEKKVKDSQIIETKGFSYKDHYESINNISFDI